MAAHGATDLTTTGSPAAGSGTSLPPVVLVAMDHLNHLVNHANGLAGQHDKALAIGTLTALVRHGHRFNVDDLCAWALANGFTASEVERLRDYSTKVLAGHRFQITGFGPLRRDIVEIWEAEVHGERT